MRQKKSKAHTQYKQIIVKLVQSSLFSESKITVEFKFYKVNLIITLNIYIVVCILKFKQYAFRGLDAYLPACASFTPSKN